MKQVIRKIFGYCLVAVLGGIFPGYATSDVQAKTPEVSAVRIGYSRGMTRFVLDIDRNITFKIFTLANPDRVVIDLTEVRWKSDYGGAKGRGYIDRYRYGLFKRGTSRIVLDLTKPVRVFRAFMIKPRRGRRWRFVLDLKRTGQKAFESGIKKPVRHPTEAKVIPNPKKDLRSRRIKKLIVLDPGHGGHDPGNLGGRNYRGFPEKTVVLNVARTIKKMLEQTGRYQVIMTRNRDVFLKLRARSRIAHNKQADLFISIHADSIKNPRIRGATVYTLSEKASDREAAALAARENKSDIIAGMDLDDETDIVQSILIDLVKRETMNLSNKFANDLISQLRKAVILRTHPHRTASLIVLKGLDVPSILLELGYLTNAKDARLLTQKQTQRNIGKAIVRAADHFFSKTYVSN